jgi:hypothetical protein
VSHNRRPLAERFWEKVDRRGPNDCWPWTAASDRSGRGTIRLTEPRRYVEKAPRVAIFLTSGKWPDGYACHSCDNPACCNPAHLWIGSPADNARDMCAKGRHWSQRQDQAA